MKMIISIVMMAFLWFFPAQAMDGKKDESLLQVKKTSSKMRRISFLWITLGFIPKESKAKDRKKHPKNPRHDSDDNKQSFSAAALQKHIEEHNEMSVSLKNPHKKNPKYAIVGNKPDLGF